MHLEIGAKHLDGTIELLRRQVEVGEGEVRFALLRIPFESALVRPFRLGQIPESEEDLALEEMEDGLLGSSARASFTAVRASLGCPLWRRTQARL
jgi:hypothetical protein